MSGGPMEGAMGWLYVGICAVTIAGALDLQVGRHRRSKACIWWAYTILVLGLFWEMIDAFRFGPPDFPSTRWLLIPALGLIQVGAALKDRLRR